MERLYLIRVDMQRFLGPFTLKQLKDAYARMEFGLQDEVSGALKQWVSFDDLDAVRRHYPELAQLVQTEMLSGWGMSTHPQMQMPRQSRKKKNLATPIALGSLFFVILVLGFVFMRGGDLNSIVGLFKDRAFQDAQTLFGEENRARFEAHMDRNHESINKAMKKKKGFAMWLPYVRALAFSRDGEWEGLSSKKLRGRIEEQLPQDCSMDAWEAIWRASPEGWSGFLEGSNLPREDWAQIMILDPNWIRNRSPVSGWLSPGSYAEACLQMSLRALQRLGSANTAWEAKVFISRLRWQLGVIRGQGSSEDFEMSGTLWALSCIEDSSDEASLSNCQSSLTVRSAWRSLLDQSMLKRSMLLILENQTTLDSERLSNFQNLFRDYQERVEKSRAILSEEGRFFQEIIQQKGDIKSARQIILQQSIQKTEL